MVFGKFQNFVTCNFVTRLFFSFIFISWRLITLQYCSGFVIHWHESAMDLQVFPILIPHPTSLSTRFLWVFPVHQARALVSCIQPHLEYLHLYRCFFIYSFVLFSLVKVPQKAYISEATKGGFTSF